MRIDYATVAPQSLTTTYMHHVHIEVHTQDSRSLPNTESTASQTLISAQGGLAVTPGTSAMSSTHAARGKSRSPHALLCPAPCQLREDVSPLNTTGPRSSRIPSRAREGYPLAVPAMGREIHVGTTLVSKAGTTRREGWTRRGVWGFSGSLCPAAFVNTTPLSW